MKLYAIKISGGPEVDGRVIPDYVNYTFSDCIRGDANSAWLAFAERVRTKGIPSNVHRAEVVVLDAEEPKS